ncbi:MAG: uracil phosphoribosyltransferase [Oscillatoriales cyanobacterium SM2_1_8]|nr:uracil phosphoribosyltransferase [Oscillatoriales cyanobacterium SM2_1_8]
MQLRVYVKDHPLIRHWLTVARDRQTPPPLFRAALVELGRWLSYEALRDRLPLLEVAIDTPLAPTTGQVISPQTPWAIVPVLRAGLALLEGMQTLMPGAAIYHVGLVRDETTLQPSLYLNRLPARLAPETCILVAEPMLATGGTLLAVLDLLAERGADMARVQVINVLCTPPALRQVGERYPALQIYSAFIDETVTDQGWIVPGLGDAGDRAFGTV